jgi:23S rRNA pseudouridine955/2504/2580 synthase
LLVEGRVDITKIKRTVYLKKVDSLSKVWISELKTSGYDPIVTEFDVIQYIDDKTLLVANLVTGKTHQIRAHIAYFGYPIVGDNKYGKSNNKTLHLTANYLTFNFKKDAVLHYMNSKSFEIVPSWYN